jgi:alkanesulfonate monooxygenase SsuD/methylene tetrahydromethanopterin reductase-like flavin-dependent oxidoreductase (luciferase family)
VVRSAQRAWQHSTVTAITRYVSPEEFKKYQEGLEKACEKLQRDPATLQRSVNLHFHMGADEAGAKVAREKLQKFPPAQRLGAVSGTAPEVIDRIAEYMEAGVDGLNIAFRPPIDWDIRGVYRTGATSVSPVCLTP